LCVFLVEVLLGFEEYFGLGILHKVRVKATQTCRWAIEDMERFRCMVRLSVSKSE